MLIEDIQDRTARLEKYVSKVEAQQKAMVEAIARGDFEAFSEEDVRFHLSHDPDMIADAGLFLAKLRRAWEYAKNDTRTVRSEVRSVATKKKEELGLSSASDRDDFVQTNPEYQKALKQEIEWKFNVELMEVIYERYQNLFAGSRKIANLIEKDNMNNYRIEKYGD